MNIFQRFDRTAEKLSDEDELGAFLVFEANVSLSISFF